MTLMSAMTSSAVGANDLIHTRAPRVISAVAFAPLVQMSIQSKRKKAS